MLNYDRNVTDFRQIEDHQSGLDVLRDRGDQTVSDQQYKALNQRSLCSN
ncbi:hypothetical protein QUA82_33850 [Microcoleus sp. F8-D3]